MLKHIRTVGNISRTLDISPVVVPIKCSEITSDRNEARYYLRGEKTQPLTKDIAELVRPLLTTSLTHGYVRRKRWIGRVIEAGSGPEK